MDIPESKWVQIGECCGCDAPWQRCASAAIPWRGYYGNVGYRTDFDDGVVTQHWIEPQPTVRFLVETQTVRWTNVEVVVNDPVSGAPGVVFYDGEYSCRTTLHRYNYLLTQKDKNVVNWEVRGPFDIDTGAPLPWSAPPPWDGPIPPEVESIMCTALDFQVIPKCENVVSWFDHWTFDRHETHSVCDNVGTLKGWSATQTVIDVTNVYSVLVSADAAQDDAESKLAGYSLGEPQLVSMLVEFEPDGVTPVFEDVWFTSQNRLDVVSEGERWTSSVVVWYYHAEDRFVVSPDDRLTPLGPLCFAYCATYQGFGIPDFSTQGLASCASQSPVPSRLRYEQSPGDWRCESHPPLDRCGLEKLSSSSQPAASFVTTPQFIGGGATLEGFAVYRHSRRVVSNSGSRCLARRSYSYRAPLPADASWVDPCELSFGLREQSGLDCVPLGGGEQTFTTPKNSDLWLSSDTSPSGFSGFATPSCCP